MSLSLHHPPAWRCSAPLVANTAFVVPSPAATNGDSATCQDPGKKKPAEIKPNMLGISMRFFKWGLEKTWISSKFWDDVILIPQGYQGHIYFLPTQTPNAHTPIVWRYIFCSVPKPWSQTSAETTSENNNGMTSSSKLWGRKTCAKSCLGLDQKSKPVWDLDHQFNMIFYGSQVLGGTPLKTNVTLENLMFNRKYIFKFK